MKSYESQAKNIDEAIAELKKYGQYSIKGI